MRRVLEGKPVIWHNVAEGAGGIQETPSILDKQKISIYLELGALVFLIVVSLLPRCDEFTGEYIWWITDNGVEAA